MTTTETETVEKKIGLPDFGAALAQQRAAAAAGEEPAPAKKAAAKKAPAKKTAARRKPPAPEPEVEEEMPLARLRKDYSPLKVQLGQRVSQETADRLRRACGTERIAQGEFIDLAIAEALDKYFDGAY